MLPPRRGLYQDSLIEESRKIAQVAWALADPLRRSILQRRMGGPVVVAELVSVSGESQPKVSNQLIFLRELGAEREAGKHSVYEISGALVAQLIESLIVVA